MLLLTFPRKSFSVPSVKKVRETKVKLQFKKIILQKNKVIKMPQRGNVETFRV